MRNADQSSSDAEQREGRGYPERQTAELQRSKQLLDETGRLARVGGWEIDLETNELSWTDVVYQIHEVEPGFRPTVEAGINFYAPEAIPVISEAVRRVIQEGEPFDIELQLLTARKKRLWVRAIGGAIRENGKIAKVRGVFQDINERKLIELELKRHREHLEELVAQRTEELEESRKTLEEAQALAQVGSWEWDAVKDEITGSKEFYRLFDVAPKEIARFTQFVERLHPEDRERVQVDVANALRQDRSYDTDYRVKIHDDTWRDINARGLVFSDVEGKPVRMAGTCMDITERKRAMAKLEESETRFRNIFENSPVAKSITSIDGELHINPAFSRMLGYTQEELSRQNWQNISHPDDYQMTQDNLARLKAGEQESTRFNKRYFKKDGSIVWGDVNTILQKDAEGHPQYFITVVVDITERKQAEEQLRRLNDALARSNQELEQFAYVASHDLQEPLRMVSSFTQLLAQRYQDKLDQDAKDFIGFAVDGANRMQRLIQDLLEYSRITTRGQPSTPIDAHDALGEAVRNLQAAIQETGALVTNEELPWILGDHTQIVQIFQNLVGNGIKFHKPGEPPRVHLSAQLSAEQPGFWTFKVVDNGIGIEPRYFERLFVIFQRLHGKQEYSGTGIGLALCKRIVERHGGHIWLESEADKGTTFFFTLPTTEPKKGALR